MSALGTMVSKKYEVDETYWEIEANKKLTAVQKTEQINILNRKGKRLEYNASAFAFFSFLTFVTATGLLIYRTKARTTRNKHHLARF